MQRSHLVQMLAEHKPHPLRGVDIFGWRHVVERGPFVSYRFFTKDDIADCQFGADRAGRSDRNELFDSPRDQVFHAQRSDRGANSKISDGDRWVIGQVVQFRKTFFALLMRIVLQHLLHETGTVAQDDRPRRSALFCSFLLL